MKRGVYIAVGWVLLVVGAALAALGATAALSVGSDDSLATAPARVRGTGVAVVADDFRVDASRVPIPSDVGTLTLTVTARDGRPVFVGAAPASDVTTYLKGAPYDVVVDLAAGAKATTRKVPGSAKPAAPGAQTFWSAQSSGTPASITARLDPGTTLVVMNADASAVVDADLVLTLHVPQAWTYSWAAAGVGALLGALGLLLLWRARVAHRRAAAETVAVTGPAPTAELLPGLDPVQPVQTPTAVPPADAVSVVVAPQGDDVPVAAPSAALAALVAEATVGGDADAAATAEIPVIPVEGPATDVAPAAVEVSDAGDLEVRPVPGDAARDVEDDADPLFDELVSTLGADPVHDMLPGVESPPGAGLEGTTDRTPSGQPPLDG